MLNRIIIVVELFQAAFASMERNEASEYTMEHHQARVTGGLGTGIRVFQSTCRLTYFDVAVMYFTTGARPF